jgi:nucleoid DNA-binding protein
MGGRWAFSSHQSHLSAAKGLIDTQGAAILAMERDAATGRFNDDDRRVIGGRHARSAPVKPLIFLDATPTRFENLGKTRQNRTQHQPWPAWADNRRALSRKHRQITPRKESTMARRSTRRRSSSKKSAKAPTKSEVFAAIAEKTDLAKRDIAAVFDELAVVIQKSLKKNGLFTLPGLCKMTVKRKAATKARKGINPFTGEEIMIKAKPASKVVRIRPLKNLKEMVA